MTIALEQLATGDVVDRNFQALAELVIDTGGRSVGVRWGSGNATFASSITAPVTITHGLGHAPVFVVAITTNGSIGYVVGAKGATTVALTAYVTFNTAVTGTFSFDWLAVG